jgi:hypothetical protein
MGIQQALFEMLTHDGSELTFAVLEDGHCAILCDGTIIETMDVDDDAALGRALRRYFKGIESHGGARHLFEVLETTHPHAG